MPGEFVLHSHGCGDLDRAGHAHPGPEGHVHAPYDGHRHDDNNGNTDSQSIAWGRNPGDRDRGGLDIPKPEPVEAAHWDDEKRMTAEREREAAYRVGPRVEGQAPERRDQTMPGYIEPVEELGKELDGGDDGAAREAELAASVKASEKAAEGVDAEKANKEARSEVSAERKDDVAERAKAEKSPEKTEAEAQMLEGKAKK